MFRKVRGPLEIEVVACRVQAKIEQRIMQYEEVLVIVRCLDGNGVTKYDYYLSNALDNTPLKEFARVSVAQTRQESDKCLEITSFEVLQIRRITNLRKQFRERLLFERLNIIHVGQLFKLPEQDGILSYIRIIFYREARMMGMVSLFGLVLVVILVGGLLSLLFRKGD